MAALALGCSLVALLGAARAPTLLAAREGAALRVVALQYARSEQLSFPRPGQPSASGPFAWMFQVVVGRGHVVLVDAGTEAFLDPARGPALRGRWRVARASTLAESLARVGLTPADVTDLVLTHHHWDHSDGAALLPNAKVHAHRAEWARAAARSRVPAGRLALFDRFPHRPLPWLELRARPGHTPFHASVEVACRAPLHLLGDAPHLPGAGGPRAGEVTGHDPCLFAPGEDVALLCDDELEGSP